MGATSNAAFLRAKARHIRQLAMMIGDRNVRSTLDQMAWDLEERAELLTKAQNVIDVLRDAGE